jgi:ribosomal-protein-alanine N-acetyltransferase
MSNFTIRGARKADLEKLIALEAHSFELDRISPRSFGRLLGKASVCVRVASAGDTIAGYYVLLFRAGSVIARLYSIAVHGNSRGSGLAQALLADAERIARRRKRDALRLEVRDDNIPAIRLYEKLGYRPIGRYQHYYADKAHALRYEKCLDVSDQGWATESEEDRSPRNADAFSSSMTGADIAAGAIAPAPAAVRSAAAKAVSSFPLGSNLIRP